jgi:crotonobetaine/carnitine-CoA ligase
VTFPETIPELLASRSASARVWLRFGDASWTVADVIAEAGRYATGLAERGVVRGDRVAILIGNTPEHLFAWLGANMLGAIAAPMHVAWKAAEIAAMVRHVGPRVIVADELRASAEAAVAMIDHAPPIVSSSEISRSRTSTSTSTTPDDVAVLLCTSGTTGAPKAVMQTHRAYTLTAEAFPSWLGLREDDRMLAMLPLAHINAQAYSVMGSLGCGAELVLAPKFSASRFWDDARRYGATAFNAVGAIVNILARAEPRESDRENPMRLCYTALALPEAQHRAFEERFGLSMRVGYGLSETTFGTIWPLDQEARYGTMGTLRQHPRLGAISEARVEPDGELLLRSPATMRGYWNDPEGTARALDGDGWLHTGDIVRRDDDGFFTFVSRKKEILRRRGENVAAAEIENALASHPAVREAAAVGVASELGEDDIVAFVSLAPGAKATGDELRAFVAARLADFKVPSRIEIRDELPHTATERIAKHLLR